jgi:hypothetical protein
VQKNSYQLNPDNRITLWNLIEKFKLDNEDKKEQQICQKTANAAMKFRYMNQAQKDLEQRARQQAGDKEKLEDKERLVRELVKFEDQCVRAHRTRQLQKKQLKSQLCVAMKDLELRRTNEKQNEAQIDALQARGPPMMQEIERNQAKIIENTKRVN